MRLSRRACSLRQVSACCSGVIIRAFIGKMLCLYNASRLPSSLQSRAPSKARQFLATDWRIWLTALRVRRLRRALQSEPSKLGTAPSPCGILGNRTDKSARSAAVINQITLRAQPHSAPDRQSQPDVSATVSGLVWWPLPYSLRLAFALLIAVWRIAPPDCYH